MLENPTFEGPNHLRAKIEGLDSRLRTPLLSPLRVVECAGLPAGPAGDAREYDEKFD
jgi:hypothetical protein